MPDINFYLSCIIAAGVCVTAFTLGQIKDRLDEGLSQGLNDMRRELESLKRSSEMRASLQHDILADIRDLLGETPGPALKKRIAHYREWERKRAEVESALSRAQVPPAES